ncbi:MAG: hypothetical protein PF904_05325 [Kiritimatiellae bacterium]|jgi:glycosyltransferase involved in cell wall biosynthesis|nr:hypothetical protein [Kiritimatiellia bacterium]
MPKKYSAAPSRSHWTFISKVKGEESLMNDAELCKRMGEAGRRHVGERFDYRVVARKFIDIVTQKLEVL